VLQEIGVEERGGDVRFKTGSGNVAVSCTGNKKICKPLGPYYRNSSDIVNLAIGQIPRSTERISIISASLLIPCLKGVLNCCFLHESVIVTMFL